MLVSTATFLLPLIACAVRAAPTRTFDQRAVPGPSPGTSCYFSCPPEVDNLGYTSSSTMYDAYHNDDPYRQCVYGDLGVRGAACYYDLMGNQYTSPFLPKDGGCPATAVPAGCGTTNPDPVNDFRKRELPRKLTEAEKAIAKRQYNPKVQKSTIPVETE